MTDLIAKAQMLIRRPAAEIFDAFILPAVLTQFWLKRASGPLFRGAQVEWEFLVAGATERVAVTAFDAPRHLAFRWLDGKLDVDIHVAETSPGSSTVSVEVRGFEEGAEGVAQVVNATEGFSIVLCDLKTLLESGRSAGLVRAKAEVIEGSRS
jgi:uncharacterized protein YndB with AHSA1/START domain